MTIGLITCGALAREVKALIEKYDWDAEIIGVPAIDHAFPERIAPDVELRIEIYREKFDRLIVIYGDCGSKGEVDRMLAHHPDIERLPGPDCYEMYAGSLLQNLREEEAGTYYLTDFMVRTFFGLIIKSMGLDRYPDLKDVYFKNYKRVVYLAQTRDEGLVEKARKIADYMELPLEIRHTGYGHLEERLRAAVERKG